MITIWLKQQAKISWLSTIATIGRRLALQRKRTLQSKAAAQHHFG